MGHPRRLPARLVENAILHFSLCYLPHGYLSACSPQTPYLAASFRRKAICNFQFAIFNLLSLIMSQHPSRKPIILVVDDELQILRVLRTSLPLWGYQVRTAQGGAEALDEIAKEMPDLIILDLAMPGQSGLDVCRRVREYSSVPIIVLSAKGSEADKVAALDIGADDYVTKPFGMNELMARVRAVLRRSAAADADS